MLCMDKRRSSVYTAHTDIIEKCLDEKGYRLTPLIVTLYEDILTDVDVTNLIEAGLQMVRLRMSRISRHDNKSLMEMLKRAQQYVCEKYDVSTWPIAICMDIPNTIVRCGYIADEINENALEFTHGAIFEITSDVKYWQNCTLERIFVDDPYTLSDVTPGTEIAIGKTKCICLEVLDKKTIKCKIISAGTVNGCEYVTFRGIKYKRPPLTKFDLQLLEFAREFKIDILIVFGVRRSKTVRDIKKLTEDFKPLILSCICDQEGLDNVDSIITATDGLILAREFLNGNLMNRFSMLNIQLQVSGKCKVAGKPFFISGDILDSILKYGIVSPTDVSDITNAVFQGAGVVIRNYINASNAVKAVRMLDSICKSVERAERIDEFWRNIDSNPVPQNAAVACVAACSLLARQSLSKVVIIPTVSGKSAIQLSQLGCLTIIIAISKSPEVTRKLQMYRGVYTILYDKRPKGNWQEETNARVQFAIKHALKKDFINYNDTYVTLTKADGSSTFCDSVCVWKVASVKQPTVASCGDKELANKLQVADNCKK